MKRRGRVITLLSDFGDTDGYVAGMKGAILSIFPGAAIVDVSHHISPYYVLSAAYVLKTYYGMFPEGTVHVVVVDPGVGGGRKALAASAGGRYFAAPDNGVLSYVLREAGDFIAREITNPELMRGEVSATFHGRDVFAPAAAHLAMGKRFEDFGRVVKSPVVLEDAFPRTTPGGTTGKIIHIDHFGNLITSITRKDLGDGEKASVTVRAAGKTVIGLSETYSSGGKGELIVYFGSSGHLEIGAVETSAALMLGVNPGDEVNAVVPGRKRT
ncbi:MAG: SAM-dependent chlorinase/fluorinase [bacterium]